MQPIRLLLSLLLLSALCTSASAAIGWTFESEHVTCDGNPFSHVFINAVCTKTYNCDTGTCVDETACGIASMKPHAAYITGGLTASTAFSNQQVVARPCLDGWFCPTRVTKVEGRLCNWLVSFCNVSCILKMKTASFQYLTLLSARLYNMNRYLQMAKAAANRENTTSLTTCNFQMRKSLDRS